MRCGRSLLEEKFLLPPAKATPKQTMNMALLQDQKNGPSRTGQPYFSWRHHATTICLLAILVLGAMQRAVADEVVVAVTNRVYRAFGNDLTNGAWVYVDADPAAGSPLRATQRSLGYREVDYKSQVPATLSFSQAVPTTNAGVITYDYSAQAAKTKQVGFWVDKDLPIIIGPDGLAYITDGHHTVAGYLAAHLTGRQFVPGKNFVVLGHIVANYYNPAVGPQPVTDAWWLARASENNAFLYGTNGDSLTLAGEPNYANLQPILPSMLAMPTTPSSITTNGVTAMLSSKYRGLTWGLADGILMSAVDSSAKKIAGYKKAAPGSSVDINFVEFFWADFLRDRIVWDDSKSGSPYGAPNGDASVTAAPLSFFTAVANGTALARSEAYRDEYGRYLWAYTNTALFPPVTVNWANGSLSNGLALATDTYHLYVRDDSGIAGEISPSALSTNILHIDTVAGLSLTQTVQNISALYLNAGGTLKTAWKDATVSNSTLTLPAGSGMLTVNGNTYVKGATVINGGGLTVNGLVTNGQMIVAGGTLGGQGTIKGAVVVQQNGTLAPNAFLNTLTINGPLVLSGTTVMEIATVVWPRESDLIRGMTTLNYGGVLTVWMDGDWVGAGDTFKLFDAGSYSGAFAACNLPALDPGLAWDTSGLLVDGTITVVAAEMASLPLLAGQPMTQTVDVGNTVTLGGGAVGGEPISYQWYYNGASLAGANGANLTLANIQKTNQGQYFFIAQNALGSATSQLASVTVNRPPTAQGQALTMWWNASLNITLGASDPDGDPIVFTVSQPAHGTLAGTVPSLTYQPALGYFGADSFTFKVNDGRLDSATVTISINVQPGFTYQDTDLLLVFRKDGFSDVLFNLGNVSNYLGHANGTILSVGNWDKNLVLSNFGGSLTGVVYVLMAVTPQQAPLRIWLTDGDAGSVPTDETFSAWNGQRSKVSQVGLMAASYYNSSNQSLVLDAGDPGSYTSIASSGGLYDVTTLGGAAPFVVEQGVGARARLYELHVKNGQPRPVALEVGGFTVGLDGQMVFTAGMVAPTIASAPVGQSVECGGSVALTVTASGDLPLSYQWYNNLGQAVSGGTDPTLTLNNLTLAQAGGYTVVVSNGGGAVTSTPPAMITVVDTAPPVLSLPGNIVVTRTDAGGATNLFYAASAADVCAGSVPVVCVPPAGSTFPLGVTTVNCTANDGNGNSSAGSFTVTVQVGFTYQDTDLLLVFRKDGFSDVLFNLGNVSNYLGQANGTILSVGNWDKNLVLANFGGSLTGVVYVLMAVTPQQAPLRIWLTDGDAGSVPTDETFSAWNGQRSKVSQVGLMAASYYNSSNQSLVLDAGDPGSYTSIASSGGLYDVTTLGGAAPFVVEQGVGARVRLYELHVQNGQPRPVALEVGGFTVGLDGQMVFTAGVMAPAIVSGPAGQSVECGGSVTLSVTASGDLPLSYQWYDNLGQPVSGGVDAKLTLNNLTLAQAGGYTVVVSDGITSVTSTPPTMMTVLDTTPPVLSLPGNVVMTRTDAGGATNLFYAASAVDVCAGSVPVVCVPPVGSTFPLGVTTVNCTANDGNGNSSAGSFTVTVQVGFTYQDTDLLLVFRKDGFSDVLFNLGNVSNYLGQANGTILSVGNWDKNLVLANFGGSLTGVVYVLMAVTPQQAPLRIWLTDGDAGSVPTDETFSAWNGQRSKVSQVGLMAASYYNSSNQSLVLDAGDPGSYTSIASSGGLYDVTTLGGAAPFVVEQGVGARARLYELHVQNGQPRPVAQEVGGFTVGLDGQMVFTAGMMAPAIVSGPTGQSVECGGSVTLSVTASGDLPLSYQWYDNLGLPVSGGTDPAFTLNNVTTAQAGGYTVVVSNGGGSATSTPPAIVNLTDLVPPTITTCPPAQTVLADNSGLGRVPDLVALTTATDNCGLARIYQIPAAGTLIPVGVTDVLVLAVDGASNTNTCTVRITVEGSKPKLQVALTAQGKVRVSWPAPASGWVLEETGAVLGSGTPWTQVPVNEYQTNGTEIFIEVAPQTLTTTFYRLRHP